MNRATVLAFDRGTVRRTDADGRLHVSVTNISKANVCPYLGQEIPGWQELGLQPDRIYRLLRCPIELAAAVDTFNNLPVLDQHVPVDAFDEGSHRPEIVIGSTGTDGGFTDPYLQNSAVIWSRSAINDIEAADEAKRTGLPNESARREWSCAYRYSPDMTPGNFRGLQYDGVMRNIIGNHVALVKEGRAGPDVMIGDCSMLNSRKALLLSGALVGLIRPRLAADSSLDFEPLLKDLNAENLAARAGNLSVAVLAAATPLLAADQSLDIDDIKQTIDFVDKMQMAADSEPPAPDKAADSEPPAPDKAADSEPPAPDKAADAGAGDDDDDEEAKKKAAAAGGAADKDKAMDSATVATMITDAVTRERQRGAAIAQAKLDVAAHIGQVTGAVDSASSVYKLALDAAGVDLTDVPKSSYRHMVAMLPKPGERAMSLVAQDVAADSDFRKRFPAASKPTRA